MEEQVKMPENILFCAACAERNWLQALFSGWLFAWDHVAYWLIHGINYLLIILHHGRQLHGGTAGAKFARASSLKVIGGGNPPPDEGIVANYSPQGPELGAGGHQGILEGSGVAALQEQTHGVIDFGFHESLATTP
jgi:hypothetical protein